LKSVAPGKPAPGAHNRSRNRWRSLCAALLLCAAPAAAQAQARDCVARVNHQEVEISAGVIPTDSIDLTLRERLLGWPRRTTSRLTGNAPPCDSQTTIAFLAAILAIDQTEGLCLAWDEDDSGYLLVPGEQNYRGRCQKTVCDRVNMLRDDALGTAATVGQLVTQGLTTDTGLRGLAHDSGAFLLSGRSGLMREALGQGAAALGGALSTPAVLTAAAVTVVAVGGAVYVCTE